MKKLLTFLFALTAVAAPALAANMQEARLSGERIILNPSFARTITQYVQNGIAFDGTANYTLVGSAVPGLSDSSVGTVAFTYRCNAGVASDIWPNSCNVFPIVGNLSSTHASAESVPGLILVFDNAGGIYGTLRVNLNDSTGGYSTNHSCGITAPALLVSDVRATFVVSWDLRVDALRGNAPHAALYKNGVLIQSGCNSVSTSVPVVVNLSNASGWSFLNGNWRGANYLGSGSPGQGELADLFMDFSTPIVRNDNTIAATNLAKFYNIPTGPVSLGPNCSSPLGHQPQICLSGPKTEFFNNKGFINLSSFTKNWVDNSGAIATGPCFGTSCATHQARQNWSQSQYYTTLVGTATTNAWGNTIAPGDLLILAAAVSSTNITSGPLNMSCPTGFTRIYENWNAAGGVAGSLPTNGLVCYKIAGASETGAYTYNWSYFSTQRGFSWVLSDYQGVNQTTPIDAYAGYPASGSGAGGTGQPNFGHSASIVAPSVTSSGAQDTLVSIFFAGMQTTSITPPPDEDMRIRLVGSTGYPQIMIADRLLTTSGATPTETATYGSALYSSEAVSILLMPK